MWVSENMKHVLARATVYNETSAGEDVYESKSYCLNVYYKFAN